MVTHNIIYEYPCQITCRISGLDGNKMSRLGNPIHNNLYRVILSLSPTQTYYDIHIYVFPHKSRDLDFLLHVTLHLMFGFHLLAIWTLSNKLFYVLLQTFLSGYFPKVMVYFCQTRMNGVTGSMGFLKDSVLNPYSLGTHNLP